MGYSAIVLNLDMREERRIAEIGFAAGTDVVSIVGFVPASPAAATLLEGMLQTGGKHINIQLYQSNTCFHITSPFLHHIWPQLAWSLFNRESADSKSER